MPTIVEIAEAFSGHRFEETVPHMLDDLEWTLVGERTIAGKAGVVAACEESAGYLADVRTAFSAFKVVAGEDRVAIDSRAEYVERDGESSHVASCDIYDFVGGRLAAITSYTVELSSG
jgi:ketosteroid isomerase-like protein